MYPHIPFLQAFKKMLSKFKTKFLSNLLKQFIWCTLGLDTFEIRKETKLNKFSDNTGNKNNPPFTQESNIWSEF